MSQQIPERWLRAGRATANMMLTEKPPATVWLAATPTGSAVPVSDTKQPLVTSCRSSEPEPPMQRFRNWRELLDK